MKKLMTLIFMLVLLLGFTPAKAEESGNTFIIDTIGILTEEQVQELNQSAQAIYDRTGGAAMFVVNYETELSPDDLAVTTFSENAPGEDGIIIAVTSGSYTGKGFGRYEESFTPVKADELFGLVAQNKSFFSCMKEFLQSAELFLADAEIVVSGRRLDDKADMLSDEQEDILQKKLDEISARQNVDIAAVIVESLDNTDPQTYADAYFRLGEYGLSSSKDGILFLVSVGDRKYAYSTHGYGIAAFTDAGLGYIEQQMVPDLRSGNYSGAIDTYADLCDAFITKAREGAPYDVGSLPGKKKSKLWLPLAVLIGLVGGQIGTGSMKSELRTVRSQQKADSYVLPGSFVVTDRRDDLVNVETRRIEENEKHTGSTVHGTGDDVHGGKSGSF
ncbi:MAG: TPM domain-containing protein [Solobacterium sp.]|nr:TPM domain-containing protein [Solobacterium sp.]